MIGDTGDVVRTAFFLGSVSATQPSHRFSRPACPDRRVRVDVHHLAPVAPDTLEMLGRLEAVGAFQADRACLGVLGESKDLLRELFRLFPF